MMLDNIGEFIDSSMDNKFNEQDFVAVLIEDNNVSEKLWFKIIEVLGDDNYKGICINCPFKITKVQFNMEYTFNIKDIKRYYKN